jgi:hypothetical protein
MATTEEYVKDQMMRLAPYLSPSGLPGAERDAAGTELVRSFFVRGEISIGTGDVRLNRQVPITNPGGSRKRFGPRPMKQESALRKT